MSQDQGIKYDQDKPRLDLLPSEGLIEIAKVMTFGASKYGDHNWRKGMQWTRVYAAAQRHLLKWNAGQTFDEETGINHLAHAGTNILFLLYYAAQQQGTDDRFKVIPPPPPAGEGVRNPNNPYRWDVMIKS